MAPSTTIDILAVNCWIGVHYGRPGKTYGMAPYQNKPETGKRYETLG